jgi:hypothetical protein
VTESDQVKAALTVLAQNERDQPAEQPAERTVSDAGPDSDDGFEWGHNGTGTATTSERADASADYRTVIERAQVATEDIEAAAEFVESVGIDRLEEAVAQAEQEVSELAADGRAALATFERFRVAMAGRREYTGRQND